MAEVMMWQGAPVIVSGGQALPAKEELEVQEGDLLRVPVDSYLVLRILGNGYVVKVDEDLELPVRDLALLKAPPSPKTIDQQLESLTQANELGPDRVTAYQNRQLAGGRKRAETDEGSTNVAAGEGAAPAVAKVAAQAAPLKKDQVPAPAPAAPPPPPPPAPVAVAAAPAGEEAQAPSEPPEAPGAALPAKRVVPWDVVRGAAVEPRQDPLPAQVAETLVDAQTLQRCVQAAWTEARMPSPGEEQVLLRVTGGSVVKVKLRSGLPAPACLQAVVGKRADIGADGWIRIRVALAAAGP